MKWMGCLVLLMFLAAPAAAQVEIVAAVKGELVSRGVDLSGPCGALEITKRVAWALRARGVGLLSKPSGNNCQGYSVDYLVFPDASGRDILGDGGGENVPLWPSEPSEPPGAFAGRWREPFDPGDAPSPVVTLPPPVSQPPPDLSGTDAITRLIRIEAKQDQTLVAIEDAKTTIVDVLKGFGKWVAGPLGSAILTYFLARGEPQP